MHQFGKFGTDDATQSEDTEIHPQSKLCRLLKQRVAFDDNRAGIGVSNIPKRLFAALQSRRASRAGWPRHRLPPRSEAQVRGSRACRVPESHWFR